MNLNLKKIHINTFISSIDPNGEHLENVIENLNSLNIYDEIYSEILFHFNTILTQCRKENLIDYQDEYILWTIHHENKTMNSNIKEMKINKILNIINS